MKGGVKSMTNNVRFTFRTPKELLGKVRKEADQKGVSVNSQLLQILWEWAKEHENKTA